MESLETSLEVTAARGAGGRGRLCGEAESGVGRPFAEVRTRQVQ